MYYVYILKGDKYYCGSTNNLKRRMQEHTRGATRTTKLLQIKELIGYYEVDVYEESLALEKRIKKSGHIHRRIDKPGFIKKHLALDELKKGQIM